MEQITQVDSDNLANIIWWIRGYFAGARDRGESCFFKESHIESLRKFAIYWALRESEKSVSVSLSLGQLQRAKEKLEILKEKLDMNKCEGLDAGYSYHLAKETLKILKGEL